MNETSVALMSLTISAIISVVVSLLSYYQNFNKNYSETISNERMVWIKETRKLASEFLGFCEANDKLDKKNSLDFYRMKNEILVNLNSDGTKYKNDAVIRELLIHSSFEEIRCHLPCIRNAFTEIFKNEWDKSKLEAGRSKNQVIKLEKRDRKLARYFKTSKN